MPRMEFEPTTLVFERAKNVHGLDLAVTVIGNYVYPTLCARYAYEYIAQPRT
jgi:hypothetical protein